VRNTLTIRGSLSDNDYDGNRLTVLGDSNDTVRLGAEWKLLSPPPPLEGDVSTPLYISYTNVDDVLLIHHEISVITM
jgi:hypothetical protein